MGLELLSSWIRLRSRPEKFFNRGCFLSSMECKLLSILIPAYNEKKTIADIIDAVKKVDLGAVKKEIIVVDDGSTDGTLEILKGIKNIKFVEHEKNSGKGAAIRTAIKHATGDIIIVQDADMEYDPNDYKALIAPIIADQAQVVYGSRRLKNTNVKYANIFYYIGGMGVNPTFRL